MRSFGMSAKTAKLDPEYAAGKEADRWKHSTARRISRPKKAGYAAVMQDESIFINAPGRGAKLWTRKGWRTVALNPGRRRKLDVVYGAIDEDGEQVFMSHDKFNADGFLIHLEKIRAKWGKVLVILDNASQHRAARVREYVKEHGRDVLLHFLPTGSPYLNAVEECWRQAKRDLIVSRTSHLRTCVTQCLNTLGPRGFGSTYTII